MNTPSSMTYGFLLGEIQLIKENKDNHAAAMKSFANLIDALYYAGTSSIDELVELLTCDDVEVVLLSVLSLGILNEAGLNATKATIPVRSVITLGSPSIIKIIAFASLAMLGDSEGVKVRTNDMTRRRIAHVRDWNGSIASTVVDYIAGVPFK